MKTKALITIVSSIFIFHSAFGQGALTPPGAPAPTMKSLDQVEARTAITNTSSLVTISQPGSYYLTHNLTVSTGDGIDISTNDVTLDLNGFTIRSTAASATGTGVLLGNGWSDITIGNGHIRGGGTNNASGIFGGGGFAYGIKTSGATPENVLVSRISVSGCQFDAISLSSQNSTVVETCTVRTVGGYGIIASTVKSCSAFDCGNTAITGDQVFDCRGQSSGVGYGVYAKIAQNCYGTCTSGDGLDANIAQNCYGTSTSGDGLDANIAQNCYGESTGSGDGLGASYTASGCYGFSSSGRGLIAFIANVCLGATATGTALSTTHNVNSY